MQLAMETEKALLIMADRLARREAARRGLDYIGTVRMLHLAEQRSLVVNAEATIQRMAAAEELAADPARGAGSSGPGHSATNAARSRCRSRLMTDGGRRASQPQAVGSSWWWATCIREGVERIADYSSSPPARFTFGPQLAIFDMRTDRQVHRTEGARQDVRHRPVVSSGGYGVVPTVYRYPHPGRRTSPDAHHGKGVLRTDRTNRCSAPGAPARLLRTLLGRRA